MRNDGVPIVGFTWYSLTDQIDWDTAPREKNNRNASTRLRLYDLDRNIRPVGRCLQGIDSRPVANVVLPTQSIYHGARKRRPEYEEAAAMRQRIEALDHLERPPTEPAVAEQS